MPTYAITLARSVLETVTRTFTASDQDAALLQARVLTLQLDEYPDRYIYEIVREREAEWGVADVVSVPDKAPAERV